MANSRRATRQMREAVEPDREAELDRQISESLKALDAGQVVEGRVLSAKLREMYDEAFPRSEDKTSR